MDHLIQKYTAITVEDLQKDLSIVYNAFIMFTVFFVFLLLAFIFRETIKKLTFFKNRKKLDLNKENNQDFSFFNVFKNIFMGISFIVILFLGLTYSIGKETLKKAQSGEVVMGLKDVPLTEIKDKITIDNNKLTIDKLPDNFYYKDSSISKNEKQEFEIKSFLFTDKVLNLVYLDEDDEPEAEYKITGEELKEIRENTKNR